MNRVVVRKILGSAAVLLGCWWFWSAAFPLASPMWSADLSALEFTVVLFLVAVFATVCSLVICFGVRLFKNFGETELKWVVGILVYSSCLWISGHLSELFMSSRPRGLFDQAMILIVSLVALGVYLPVAQLLLRYLSGTVRCRSSLINRGVLIVLAWLLWLFLSAVYREYAPILKEYPHLDRFSLDLLGLILPIVLSYGAYQTVISRIERYSGVESKVTNLPPS